MPIGSRPSDTTCGDGIARTCRHACNGLTGVTLDVTVAAGSTLTDSNCPVQVCVPIFVGEDPLPKDPFWWHWDWSDAGPENQRLYLLTAPNGVIAIFVDSVDGTTFDTLTKAFDQISPTIRFG